MRFSADTALAEQDCWRPLVSTSKNTIDNLSPVVWRSLATDLDFVLLGFPTFTAVALPFVLARFFVVKVNHADHMVIILLQ